MLPEPLKLGLIVLLLMPGFLWVQVRDHHLARENRPQFEHTFAIILVSSFIWILALMAPWWWPWGNARSAVLTASASLLAMSVKDASEHWGTIITLDSGRFFVVVCGWTFVIANGWGVLRKSPWIDIAIRWCTGRAWYPTVSFQFFQRNLNKTVVLKSGDNLYWGVLTAAPDNAADPFIILTEVSVLEHAHGT